MKFQVGNLTSRAFIMKSVELVLGFVLLLVYRLGNSGDTIHWGEGPRVPVYPDPPSNPFYTERAENDLIVGILASPGYFFITLVLMLGLALGDTSKYGMCLFNIFGFLFHISAGSVEIWAARKAKANGSEDEAGSLGLGSLAIIASFPFLVDSVWSIMDLLPKTKK